MRRGIFSGRHLKAHAKPSRLPKGNVGPRSIRSDTSQSRPSTNITAFDSTCNFFMSDVDLTSSGVSEVDGIRPMNNCARSIITRAQNVRGYRHIADAGLPGVVDGGSIAGDALIAFRLADGPVLFVTAIPDPAGRDPTCSPPCIARTGKQTNAACEPAVRQRRRVLTVVIKAKLQAVNTGIATVEVEFRAHIVSPDGQSIGRLLQSQIRVAHASGNMRLLPCAGGDHG